MTKYTFQKRCVFGCSIFGPSKFGLFGVSLQSNAREKKEPFKKIENRD